jgi:hypothetical protein
LGSEPWIPDKQILEICHCRSETILLTPNSSCEACSAFTRAAACTLARSPYFVTRYPKASDISISSNSSPSSTPQYAHGQWFPVTGVARWDEFVPIKAVWVDNQPSDRKVLDKSSRWGDMPFLMLAKCAEAQAIRKGWPEDLSNTFVGEEIDQEALNLHPAQEDA